ncbi:MAG: hypothetical protein D6723_02425 [Acidobacteria bacterium]|nr:MAG: hypothetical protein D6723_02425 [Acidobacteriota bacterium]
MRHAVVLRKVVGPTVGVLAWLFIQVAPVPAQLDLASPLVLQSPNAQVGFGFGLAGGDINGDGYDDVIVGSVLSSVGDLKNAGRVFVFFGGSAPDGTPDLVLQSPQPEAEARFGWSIAVGDINGDGYGDIVVSALLAQGGARSGRGAAYVFFGGPTPDAQADVTLARPADLNANARYGWALTTGDLNGDGLDEIVVGGQNVEVLGTEGAGQVFVYFGSRSFRGTLGMTLISPRVERAGEFGNALISADFNGDGYDDVAVAATGQSVGNAANAGQVFLFFGSPAFDATSDLALQQSSPTRTARFGFALAAGDINGDGFKDVIVGVTKPPRNPLGRTNQGEVHVFPGGEQMSATAAFVCSQPSVDGFGSALASGDVNRDQRDDVIVGVPTPNLRANSPGRALIFFGGVSLDCAADLTLESPEPASGDQFGSIIATGDVNGDGRLDVIIGAPHPPSILGGGGAPGRAFVYFGR